MAKRFSMIIVGSFLLVGCLGKPLHQELSIDHPANPHAPETVFTPPPSPFHDERKISAGPRDEGTVIPKDESAQERMDHPMDHVPATKPEPETPDLPPEVGSHHHQKGTRQ
jgi:hypothetical protein